MKNPGEPPVLELLPRENVSPPPKFFAEDVHKKDKY